MNMTLFNEVCEKLMKMVQFNSNMRHTLLWDAVYGDTVRLSKGMVSAN